jgi:hypothetical protein
VSEDAPVTGITVNDVGRFILGAVMAAESAGSLPDETIDLVMCNDDNLHDISNTLWNALDTGATPKNALLVTLYNEAKRVLRPTR